MSEPTRFHAGFVVDDPRATADFFATRFGFRPTVARPEYVQVRHDGLGVEIGFVLTGLPESPSVFRAAFAGNGAWLTIEVADLAAALEPFVAENYPLVEPIRDRSFGERHFVVRAPGGILINVVERKPN